MKLYEITADMRTLFDMLENDLVGLDDIADQMEALEMDFQDKVENSVKMIKTLGHQALACHVESSRLADRAKRIESQAKWLTDYLIQQMIGAGRPKLVLPEFTTTVRTPVQSVFITFEADIPEKYRREKVTVTIDKREIKAAITAGVDVPGAKLIDGKPWLDIR